MSRQDFAINWLKFRDVGRRKTVWPPAHFVQWDTRTSKIWPVVGRSGKKPAIPYKIFMLSKEAHFELVLSFYI